MKNKFRNKKFLITGGTGFLGQALANKLKSLKCKNIFIAKHQQYDLVNEQNVKRLYKKYKPNIVFHLAAAVGGIGINKKNPGKFFYNNGWELNIIHHAFEQSWKSNFNQFHLLWSKLIPFKDNL